MKFSLRSQVAALALLAPLGAAIAQPVVIDLGRIINVQATFGAPTAVAQPARIDRFVIRAEGAILTGSELRFRVVGSPGSRVLLEVPGVMRNVVIPETRPGVYELGHVVRYTEHPSAFPAAAVTLEKGGKRLIGRPEIVDGREYAIERPVQRPVERPIERRPRDTRPPVISDLTPGNGDRIRERRTTEISAKLSDEGSGIDRDTLVMRVDGRDVTNRVRFDGDEIRFRDDLGDGRHTAEVLVRDRAGNFARRSWTFNVMERGRYGYSNNGNTYGQGQNR
jgi:hypothetical protein